jgi:two-component system response regulator FixJ
MTQNPVVFAIDDDEMARESVCAIASSMGYQCKQFEAVSDFLEAYSPLATGCIVTDVRMPEMGGLDLLKSAQSHRISLPIIIISAFGSTKTVVESMQLGATTFLDKPCNDHELFNAIQEAVALSHENLNRVTMLKAMKTRTENLTDAERQVMDLIVDGEPNKSISMGLGISLRTVELRRQKIFEKTGTTSVAALVRLVWCCDRLNENPGIPKRS